MMSDHDDEWPTRGELPSIGDSERDAHLAFVLPLLTAEDEEDRKQSLRDALLDFGTRFIDTLDLLRGQAGLEEKGAELVRLEAHAAEALVFVHGYNVSFADSALRAAQFVVDLNFEGTAMLYSWPSEGKTRRYRFDEGEANWTVDDFKVFLKTVLAETGFSRVHIVAHSMGNRVVTEGIRRLDPATLPPGSAELVEAVFAAPDVDADTFHKFAAEFHHRVSRMTLYASARDKPLSFSQKVHRYPRAGDLRDGMVITEGLDSIDISAVDTSFMGHSYFAENRSILNDLCDLIRGVKVGPDRNELEECLGPGGAKYWAVKA